jgi:nucleotidyltransferase substrate binding protein (TIGR01987 family)
MSLDFSSLDKAMASLNRAIHRANLSREDEELRDAVIQRFEYTYELCWKMLKRQLEAESPYPQSVDTLSFRELLRESAERGMITDVEKWLFFRERRNQTSHTYDAEKAAEVYLAALEFQIEAERLLSKLRKRQV